MVRIKANIFYVTSEEKVYICWEKVPGVTDYYVIKNGEILTDDDDKFIRPEEFDDDHHTQLFYGQTRYWLCYKDADVQKLQNYSYKVIGRSNTINETYESNLISVNTV